MSYSSTTLWWGTAYLQRFEVNVTTGATKPDRGYDGYTARIPALDTVTLIVVGEMQADCSDLRVTYYDGLGWQELPRHVLSCNTAATDIRFALAVDTAAGGNDDNCYLYHNNAAPAALPAVSETNVYLWYYDVSIDRSGSYTRGRIGPWHGSGWDDSLVWSGAGYYTYDNGDNFASGYRIAIDERDVYAETEFSTRVVVRSTSPPACWFAASSPAAAAGARKTEISFRDSGPRRSSMAQIHRTSPQTPGVARGLQAG